MRVLRRDVPSSAESTRWGYIYTRIAATWASSLAPPPLTNAMSGFKFRPYKQYPVAPVGHGYIIYHGKDYAGGHDRMLANPGPLLYTFLYYDKNGTMFYPSSPVTTDGDGNEYILSVNCRLASGGRLSDVLDGEDWICSAATELDASASLLSF